MIGFALAAVLAATPADIATVVAQAKPGDVIQASGVFGPLVLKGVSGITVQGGEFRAADWRGCIYVLNSANVTVQGVHCIGDGAMGTPGITLRAGNALAALDNLIEHVGTGVWVGQVRGFTVEGNQFWGLNGDGVDLGASTDGVVDFNICSGGVADYTKVHPDCAQSFDPATQGGVANARIEIHHNVAFGKTQGFDAFQGAQDFYVHDNYAFLSMPQGVAYGQMQGVSRVDNNRTFTLPRAPFQVGVNTDATVTRCGNAVAAYGQWSARTDPGC